MTQKVQALKGNICFCEDKNTIVTRPGAYLVYEGEMILGVFDALPEMYRDASVQDFGDQLILPGLVDLHIHAPQYTFRGLGMDMELLKWLEVNTFPEEARYADLSYAEKAYRIFTDRIRKSATTRLCIFATRHVEATELLMDMLEDAGIHAMVGKVNMDRNAPDELAETSAKDSLADTERWLREVSDRYTCVAPILTPRFIPSCSDALLRGLGELAAERKLPVQSHLSENPGEVELVKQLCPWSSCYGDAYEHFQLFGSRSKTIMAHCVYSSAEERALMKKNGVFIAHCPESNANIASGIAPAPIYLDEDMPMGLGSDVAGGSTENLFRAMVLAIQVSKLRWRLQDETLKPLTIEEAFYLGTKGGGAFFGRTGSLETGYTMDAIVIDDSAVQSARSLTLRERLERVIYFSDECRLVAKYSGGSRINMI